MFCKNCGAKINDGTKFCASCGSKTSDTPPNKKTASQNVQRNLGMATITIRCKKYKHIVWRMMRWFIPSTWTYKFYYSIDGKEYQMNSKNEVKQINVPAGEHILRIGYKMKENTAKLLAAAGNIVATTGAVVGDANWTSIGSSLVLAYEGTTDITQYFKIELNAGDNIEFKLKENFFETIVEDK